MNNLMTVSHMSSLPRSEVVSVATLGDTEREQMFLLLSDYFDGVTRERFERDLAEKESAVLLRGETGAIKGFSTIMRLRTVVEGEPVGAFFSGDTIVARDCWGESELPRLWSRHVFGLRAQMPERRVYWFLISSGYKTYRFLSVFFREFYPTFRRETPAFEQRALDALARQKFDGEYRHGVVRFAEPMPLRAGVAELTPARLRDPHVAFFAAKNPGHARGDELACLCEIAHENLTPAGRRMVAV
jgi:hypothetical protein